MTTRRELFKFAGGSAMGAAAHAGPVAADHGHGAVVGELARRSAAGARRDPRQVHQLRAVRRGLRGARAVRGRAARGAGGCGWRAVPLRRYRPPSALSPGAPAAGQREGSGGGRSGGRDAPSSVAVLDLRPGRTASWTYRRAMAALPNGVYVAAEEPAVHGESGGGAHRAQPGSAPAGWLGAAERVFAARPNFRLIQAEAVESRTAALADEWLAVRPGTEAVLGRAVAGTISARQAAEIAGLAVEQVAQLARALREDGPALILAPRCFRSARVEPAVGRLGQDRAAAARNAGPRGMEDGRAGYPTGGRAGRFAPRAADRRIRSRRARAVGCHSRGNWLRMPWWWPSHGRGRRTHAHPRAAYRRVSRSAGRSAPAVDSPAAEFRLTVPLTPAPAGMVDPAEFISASGGVGCQGCPEGARRGHPRGRTWQCCGRTPMRKSTPVKETQARRFLEGSERRRLVDRRGAGFAPNAPKPGDSSAPASRSGCG